MCPSFCCTPLRDGRDIEKEKKNTNLDFPCFSTFILILLSCSGLLFFCNAHACASCVCFTHQQTALHQHLRRHRKPQQRRSSRIFGKMPSSYSGLQQPIKIDYFCTPVWPYQNWRKKPLRHLFLVCWICVQFWQFVYLFIFLLYMLYTVPFIYCQWDCQALKNRV